MEAREKNMDAILDAMADELRRAAMRWGVPVSVNGHGDGLPVTLGRNRAGCIVMLRRPTSCEGNRTAMHQLDAATAIDGPLPPATLAWVEGWAAMDLGAAAAWERALTRRGLDADRFCPEMSDVNAFVLHLLGALGCDLSAMLASAEWRPSADGYSTALEHPALRKPAAVHRHLGRVRLSDLATTVDGATIIVNDSHDGDECTIEIHGAGPLPDAVVIGAAGLLSTFVSLPGDAGRLAQIVAARTGRAGDLIVHARCPRTPFQSGERI